MTTETKATKRPLRWTFGDDVVRAGFTDGSTWNGFDNVWVTPEVHREVVADLAKVYDGEEIMDELRALQPETEGEFAGLICYANCYTTQEAEMEEPKVADTVDIHRARELAEAFTREICETLTPEQLAEVRRLNRGEAIDGVCHTHDFCDANECMLAAFRNLFGRDVEFGEEEFELREADAAMTDAAWQIAKYDEFTPNDPASGITETRYSPEGAQADSDRAELARIADESRKAEEVLQTMDASTLAEVVARRVDLNALASAELAKRGMNAKGLWVGFDFAKRCHDYRMRGADVEPLGAPFDPRDANA